MPCQNPDINWIIPTSDCVTSPCNGCDTNCIDLDVLPGCEDVCVQVNISCPSCGVCETVTKNICLCDVEGDCELWEDCIDGVCVDQCDNYHDQYGNCVDCLDNAHCEGDYVCKQGNCQCPAGTTDLGNGVCRECLVDSDCPDCQECSTVYCVEKICPGQVCLDDECVECINSGDCGLNECCQPDNTCDCCNGFERDPGGSCVPVAICNESEDCPDCQECVGGNCVDKVCPEGYTCYKGDCVELCNCLEPSCDAPNKECKEVEGKCICVDCDPCEDVENPGSGETPDPNNPSNPGTGCSKHGDCGSGKSCEEGKCEDCENCPDGSGGTYDNCIENFVINKDDASCKIEGILETSIKCNCDLVTWSSEVLSRDGDKFKFRLRLREGNAFEKGINNIPLLRNLGIVNAFPNSGSANIKIIEKFSYVQDGTTNTKTLLDKDFDFTGTDEIVTKDLRLNKPGTICVDSDSGENVKVETVVVKFSIPAYSLYFDSGCIYSIESKEISYVVKSFSGNGIISTSEFFDTNSNFLKYQVLTSNESKRPVFKWFKSNSHLEDGGQLIRKAYSSEVDNYKFRDAWLDISDGVEVQYHYRLESDCSCTGKTYFKCNDNPSELYFCNPDITNLNYTLSNCNKSIELSNNDFVICNSNSDYPQKYDLLIDGNVVETFTPVGNNLTIDGVYSSQTSIETLQVKLNGVDCEDCYDPINVMGSSLGVTFNSYDCSTDQLSITITGGSGNYTVLIDGNPWTIGDAINLTTGSHTIKVIDDITDCEVEDNFDIDCCAIFQLTAPDTDVCETTTGSYDFSVSGGEADYTWSIYESKGGILLDSGVSTSENITADLSTYSGSSFFVEVTDNKLCSAERVVYVNYVDGVTVDVTNKSYCTGDATLDVTVNVQTGSLPISYDLKQASVSQQTGTITTASQQITINTTGNNNFNLELTDSNGCFLDKPVVLNEMTCPDPVITASPGEVCEGLDLIVSASISNGTQPYSWSVTDPNSVVHTGSGGNISVNTGNTFSSTPGSYQFTIDVEDLYGKTDSTQVTYVVLSSTDPECVNCGPEPSVDITSDVGWSVSPDDPVEVTHDFVGAISQTWYVNGVQQGYNASLFPDTSTPGSYDIYVEIEYETSCTTDSVVKTLTVTVPCSCDYDIQLDNGWGGDNGSTITDSTTSSTTECVGNTITATAIANSCGTGNTYKWELFEGSNLITTINSSSFSDTISNAGVYSLKLSGMDGSCVVDTVTFTKEFEVCRTCDLTSDSIANKSVCEGKSVDATLNVSGKWQNTDLRFRTRVDGVNYGTSPQKCYGSTSCSHTQSFSGLSVGTHNIEMDAYEFDVGAGLCLTEQAFTITVKPITDPSCKDCGDNTATINVSGEYDCGGGTCKVNVTEGQTLTLSASATGNVGGFTYQWYEGPVPLGGGSSIDVGPFEVTDNKTYDIYVTDLEGCEFSKSINIVVQRDCSGAINSHSNPTTACSGDSVNILWDTTGLYREQDYIFSVHRSLTSQTGPFQEVSSYNLWSDYYQMTMPNSDYWYFVRAVKGNCVKESSVVHISLDTCVDCTGTVSSISASPSSQICVGDSVNLTANVSGDTSGWTYTWREGTSSSGTIIGSGTSVTGYIPPSLPQTVRVWYSKTGCTSGYKEITITQASSCCDTGTVTFTTDVSEACNNDQVKYRLNHGTLDPAWSVDFKQGNYPGTSLTYTTNTGSGYTEAVVDNYNFPLTVTAILSRQGCSDQYWEKTITKKECCGNPTAEPLVLNSDGSGGDDKSRCQNEEVRLTADNPVSGWTYNWYKGTNNTGTLIGIGSSVQYTKTTRGSENIYLEVSNGSCPIVDNVFTITEDSSCCYEPAHSMTVSPTACKGEDITIYTINTESGWTYSYYNGTSDSGSLIETKQGGGTLVTHFTKPNKGSTNIFLKVSKSGCPDWTDLKTVTESTDCCPSGITLTEICNSGNMQLRVNGLQDEDIVQFNSDTPITGPHSGGNETYTWSGTGVHTVHVYIYRQYCEKCDINNDPNCNQTDSIHYEVKLIR